MESESILDLTKRDEICKMICKDFILPQELKEELKNAIRQYQNINLKNQTLEKLVNDSMNLKQNIHSLNFSINHFDGYINEYICAYEYNSLKNNDHVLTILNPDSSSKTDILHIITTSNGVVVKAGGDVKSGSPTYVLNQYEKLLVSKYDVPFIDYSGYLTESIEKSLSKNQQEKLSKLMKMYPNKRPVKPILNNLDRLTIRRDILKYLATGKLPSFSGENEWKVPTSRDEVLKLKDDIVQTDVEMEKVEWKSLKVNSIKTTHSKDKFSESGKEKPMKGNDNSLKKQKINETIKNEKTVRGKVIKFPKQKKDYGINNEFEDDEFGSIDHEYILRPEPGIFKEIKDKSIAPKVNVPNKGKKLMKFFRKAGSILKPVLLEITIEILTNPPSRRKSQSGYLPNKTNENAAMNEIFKEVIKERKSPIPHEVKGHRRIFSNGKEIDVRPYNRGKN